MVHLIYLDYNGTTPLDQEVVEAMRPFLETEFGNPSSSHWYGIRPKQAVEASRRQVAGLLNCHPQEVFFTSGGTESNNHAIMGMARALKEKGRHIITSTVEHPAVLEEIGLGVAASAGAACHADTVTLSHVLEAIRLPVEWAKGTIRFSTGRMTTSDQIDRAVTVVVKAVQRLRLASDEG